MANNYLIGEKGPYSGTNVNQLGPGGTAIYVANRKNPAVTVYNGGTKTVYLDSQDPGGASAQGQPLSPSSSIGWDAGQGLYVTTAVGETSTVTVTENAGNIFDAGAIAAQILSQGLAQQIATAISISGAPPIDKFTLLNSQTFGSTGAAGGPFDVTSYQSLTLIFTNISTTPPYMRGLIRWYADAAGTIEIASDSVVFNNAFANSGEMGHQLDMPVRGPYMGFTLAPYSVVAGTYSVRLYGSYKARTRFNFTTPGTGSAGDGSLIYGGEYGVQNWNGAIPAAGIWAWSPDVVAGPARLSLRFGAAITFSMNVRHTQQTLIIYESESARATATNEIIHYDFLIPPGPLEIQLTAAAAVVTFRATLVTANPYQN